jgi:hypothetical protein
MTKTTKTTKAASKKQTKTTVLTDELKALEFQSVEVTGGKKFPVGTKAVVLKVDMSKKYSTVYAIIRPEGTTDSLFIDPQWLKAIGSIKPAKKAALSAELEADREATLLVAGKVREERETSILLDHHGWYQSRWFPKSLITLMATEPLENGEFIYEAPRWKVKQLIKDKGIEALEELQSLYQDHIDAENEAAVAAKAAKAKPAKPELIKSGTVAAEAAKTSNTAATVAAIKAKLAKRK